LTFAKPETLRRLFLAFARHDGFMTTCRVSEFQGELPDHMYIIYKMAKQQWKRGYKKGDADNDPSQTVRT
jgi:hypothetical protein